jgi:UDP-glucuronate 4-epimerase
MRALVTGAAGFIGSQLSARLLADGHDVTGLDAFTPYYDLESKRANLQPLLQHPGFGLVEADLRTADLQPFTAVDVVFHLAAQPGVRTSWGEPFADYLGHNTLATQRLLEASRAMVTPPRFVLASSSSIYGEAERHPTSEDLKPRPVSPYGVTKLAAEQLLEAYAANFGVEGVALRFFTVYGPGQRPDMAFHRFIEAALQGRPITVYGDGEQRRDVTHVADAVRATVLAMRAPAGNAVVNVGGGRPVTVNHALELIGQVTGRRLEVVHAPARAGDARHTGADGTRAEALLDWRAEVDLATGLTGQAAWVAGRVPADIG